ncbi:nuclear transport factor 2 family protein [Microbacterium sp. A196]|uniref:nuclear transport factor 2 family protein n=1 Tax=Microbacterium sp. A196 TaxID=3457320 RepID=UPI003FD5E026
MTSARIPAFGLLLRDYAFAYTASHDFGVCDRLMIEDYVLRMGEFEIRGRDDAYKPATEKQYRQYPGLGFTVHDFMTNGDRAALRFSEHGKSLLTGALTSWRGISMYRWDGERLTECRVEQDYFSRRRQSESAASHEVPSPGADPWTDSFSEASRDTESAVRAWLERGDLFTSNTVEFDDELEAGHQRARLEELTVDVLDLFSCGEQAAFHIRAEGVYTGGLGSESDALIGVYGALYASGYVNIASGRISGHVVTDRLSYTRRLTARA